MLALHYLYETVIVEIKINLTFLLLQNVPEAWVAKLFYRVSLLIYPEYPTRQKSQLLVTMKKCQHVLLLISNKYIGNWKNKVHS